MTEMSKAAIFTVDGIPQAFVTEVEDDIASEDKIIKTLQLGATGHSDGATVGRFNFKAAIPLSGRELDFQSRCANHVTTRLGVRMGGKTLTMEGRFLNVRERSGVDDHNMIDGSFEGRVLSNL